MEKILLIWTYESDLIECPEYVSNNLKDYQMRFDKWLSDKNNHHGYWTKDCEDNDALCFGSDAFVDWLNENIIKEEKNKAKFVKRDFQANKEEMLLPHIYF